MKKYIICLFVMLAASQALQAQAKSDTIPKVDSLIIATDVAAVSTTVDSSTVKGNAVSAVPPVSTTVLDDSLLTANDSLTMELYKLRALYNSIKEKIMKRDFDPLKMSEIIDSLALKRDSTFSGFKSSSAYLKDSIKVLNKEISRLNARIANMTSEDLAFNKMVSDLKMLKELLDARILTNYEFEIRKASILEKYK